MTTQELRTLFASMDQAFEIIEAERQKLKVIKESIERCETKNKNVEGVFYQRTRPPS